LVLLGTNQPCREQADPFQHFFRKKTRDQNLARPASLNQRSSHLEGTMESVHSRKSGFKLYRLVPTVRLLFRKSRISWYQNRPKDFSSPCFLSTMHNCEPLPVVQHRTVSS
jgi:hypothetical protein